MELINEFMALARIDSATGKERTIADAIKEKLIPLGCTVTEDNAGGFFGGNCGNVLAVLAGTAPGSLLFTAHMDRVAGGLGIEPVIEGDRIVSAGDTILSADDLSGVMAIIDGVRRVIKSGKPHPRLELLFCVGEETGLLGSKHFDCSVLQSKMGYALDSPGNLGRMVTASAGRAELCCEVYGKSAHAGNEPEKGINAVTALGKVLCNIKDGRIDEETTANFALLETGSPSLNAVQHYARVQGEVRSHEPMKLKEYIEYFHRHCKMAVYGTGARVETTAKLCYGAFRVPEEHPVIALAKKVFDEMSVPHRCDRAGGGMDANNLNTKGIACIGLATGYFKNHTNEEYLSIPDFLKAGEMVEKLILNY